MRKGSAFYMFRAKQGASVARAKYHYVADWFYPDPAAAEGYRRDSAVIAAYDDAEAIREARPLAGNPVYWRVRRVTRTGEEVIHDSRTASRA